MAVISPFDFSIYACALGGIAMILGSIWLLRTRVIQLADAENRGEVLSVDILKKIKISTNSGAIALFVIGLLLFALAIWFSKPSEGFSLSFDGQLANVNPALVTGKIVPVKDSGATFTLDSDGACRSPLHPEFPVEIQINAAGYEPAPWHRGLPFEKGKPLKIDLAKEVQFTRKPDSTSPPQGSIAPADDLKNAPKLQEGTGLKVTPPAH
ncbi:MAG TPA: hypothetical protein VEP30_09430 [Chthoniobacterales bacterium]|nr:hypothetical protein [Chthoniobacterales bacterium]